MQKTLKKNKRETKLVLFWKRELKLFGKWKKGNWMLQSSDSWDMDHERWNLKEKLQSEGKDWINISMHSKTMSLAIRTSSQVIQFFVFGSDFFTTRKKMSGQRNPIEFLPYILNLVIAFSVRGCLQL